MSNIKRTYKSKKDAPNVIERRDLFQNLDGKSTAYDAFSIQNIKQTKRELSCVGTSNTYRLASKVRKKKYVKRIVKEIGTPCRESMGHSTYLTPDKSIHVNKPLDPFDLLLLSSPAPQVAVKLESPKENRFDQVLNKKQGRTYTRKKPKRIQRNSCSSTESSDSDKENSDGISNITHNSSDIRTHKLLVEQEYNITPKRNNDSINNIVNNLSLLHKLKNKYTVNDSANKSLRLIRHRLTRNIQSPFILKSPMCSTPFKSKYRGESIFKFSPITATNENHPKLKDKDNSSLHIDDVNVDESVVFEDPQVSTNVVADVEELNRNSGLLAQENAFCKSASPSLCRTARFKESSSYLDTDKASNIDIGSLQTTEIEPFLGFAQNAIVEMITQNENLLVQTSCFNNSIPENDITNIKALDSTVQYPEVSGRYQSGGGNNDDNDEIPDLESNRDTDTIRMELNDNDKDVEHNTITPETNADKIDLNKINMSFVEESQSNITETDKAFSETDQSNSRSDTNNEDDSDNVSSSQSEDNDSLYDTCTSEQSFIQEKEIKKEPVVILQRMNDSSFFRYYNDKSRNVEIDKSDENFEDSVSEFGSLLANNSTMDNSYNHLLNTVENNLFENVSEDYGDDVASCSNDENSMICEEETCISFVTTRRRKTNNSTRHSMISLFSDSYNSSNAECDKTVLTNNKELEEPDFKRDSKDNNGTIIDLDINYKQSKEDNDILDLSVDSESKCIIEQEPRISFVTTRNNNISNRNSSSKHSISHRNSALLTENSEMLKNNTRHDSFASCLEAKPGIVLKPGKKWARSLSIYRRMTVLADINQSILGEELAETKGRKYRQSVISTIEIQDFNGSLHNESINSRRSTFVSKPSRSTIRIVKDPNSSRLSLCSDTTLFDDLKGFLNEECDDTIIELSKLSIADQSHEVTVLDNFHDTSNRIDAARDYVLRRCNQTDPIIFDECYPDAALKNCHKIGEGVYGEVFLWRDRDGRARVLKIVPIAGNIKVNGESQKDFHEIISEIVIAMELSALRTPIAELEQHFDEGKDVDALDLHAIENATDVFNEVLAVRCVYGSYPSRLLDLWDLYDECKGSENDNPAILPADQQYIVLELANAGQDLESYQFNNAEQAHALFLQVAYGLAVAEEAFQFEHRDLHWGNVLISPTEQKYATFVVRGRAVRVARCGVRGAVIDYSLSRVALRLGGAAAALYNDLAADESLFDAVGDYQFQVYRLMRDKLRNDWKNFEPYTNILWLHYTVDKMITALRYKRTNTKIHKHYIDKLKGIKDRILNYGSAAQFVLTDNEV